MREMYTNKITETFDNFNPELHHYMYYDESDINNKELPVIIPGKQVGSVVLNNSNKIFAVYVNTNLIERYTDEFEKYVSDKFMDRKYEFDKDVIFKT